MQTRGRAAWYWVGGAAILCAYGLVAAFLLATKDFDDRGPLSKHQPALTSKLAGGIPLETVLDTCFPDRDEETVAKVVGGTVGGRQYYACYWVSGINTSTSAAVIDTDGHDVGDADVIKAGGAWPWVGPVTSASAFLQGGVIAGAMIVLLGVWHLVKPRPWRHRRRRVAVLVATIVGLVIFGFAAWFTTVIVLAHRDLWGIAVATAVLGSTLYGVAAGRALLVPGSPLPWLSAGPSRRALALALAGCVVAIPALVAGMIFVTALGGQNTTPTFWEGTTTLAALIAALGAAILVGRWVRAKQAAARSDEGAASAPGTSAWSSAILLGAVSLIVGVAVSAVVYRSFDALDLEYVPATTALAIDVDLFTPSSFDRNPREQAIVDAMPAAVADELIDVSCIETGAGAALAPCVAVFEGIRCQLWTVDGDGPYTVKSLGAILDYERWFTTADGSTTCS